VLVIYEGAVDAPYDDLEGATPLQIARNVHASALAKRGKSGCLLWQETGDVVSRTEHALALLLGVKPAEARNLRRGPVEAAAIDGREGHWTYAYRGNLATIDQGVIRENRVSGLTDDETTVLRDALRDQFSSRPLAIDLVGPGRLVVMFDRYEGPVDAGKFPEVAMETGFAADVPGRNDRERFMIEAGKKLATHPVNDVRVDLGENPASGIWLWGGGAPASVSRPFLGAPLKSVMITNSALARGMASLCGMKIASLGDVWTDLTRPELISREDLAEAIARHELTVIFVESPLEGGCFGEPVEKVKAMDRLDVFVLSRIMEAAAEVPDTRIMLTSVPEESVEFDFSPVIVSGANVSPDQTERWQEESCENGSLGRLNADQCLTALLGE